MIIFGVQVILVLVLTLRLVVAGLAGFSGAVPAFGALLHPQQPSLVGTRRANCLAGGAARDGHHILGPGLPVLHAPQQRPHAHLLLQGKVVRHLVGDHGRVRPGPHAHAATSGS